MNFELCTFLHPAYLIVIAVNQITAIAWLTLKENLRSKVFLILLLTGALVTAISLLFPVIGGAEDRIMLVESICLKSITFFGMMIAAILSATSIPKDAEDKSIYSIITKPVNRLNLILGKILGFIYVTGIIVTFMGCLSVLLIRHAASKELTADNTSQDFNNDNKVNENIIFTTKISSDSILKARKQTSSVELSINGEYQETPGGTKWIECGKGTAVWTISGLRKTYPGKYMEVEIDPGLEGSDSFIPLEVGVINPETDKEESCLINARIGERLILRINRQAAERSDQLIIEISPKNSGDYFGVNKKKVKIFYNYGSFEYNFLKAVAVIFFQIVLIIFIGVTGSTFFKTPAVSIFFILFVFLCGFMVDYLRDLETVINVGDYHSHSHEHGLPLAEEEPGILFTFLNNLLENAFDFLILVMPNFNRFNMEGFILNRIDIPMRNVVSLLGYASIYFLACVGLSAVIVSRREI